MDTNSISSIAALLAALSVASERLVEIVKNLWPWLNQENADPKIEGRRKSTLQVFAVVAGIITAWLANPALPSVLPHSLFTTIALGLLASGGSGFWNSIQTYVNKAKEAKAADAQNKKLDVANRQALAQSTPQK
jgi:hypothetical protein